MQRWGQSTEYGVQRAEQATTRPDPGLPLPPRAEPARDYQRGYTPGLARSVRSPDPTRHLSSSLRAEGEAGRPLEAGLGRREGASGKDAV